MPGHGQQSPVTVQDRLRGVHVPRDGHPPTLVRALGRPGDRQRLKNLCPRLSPQTRYLRFQGALNDLSEHLLDHLLDVDHQRREALVALEEDEIVGVARYAVSPDDSRAAEVAVVVADAWQHRGIATQLLAGLRESASRHDIVLFKASVLPVNEPARRLITGLAPDHRMFRDTDGLEYRWSTAVRSARQDF